MRALLLLATFFASGISILAATAAFLLVASLDFLLALVIGVVALVMGWLAFVLVRIRAVWGKP